jgi:hypothetical protein
MSLATPRTAVVLGAVALGLFVADIPAGALAHQLTAPGVVSGGLAVAFAVVGVVVAWKQPGNPIGWCMLGSAFFIALDGLASSYSVLDYRMHHGHLLLGGLAVVAQPSWAPAIFCFALAVVLFPDGTLPSGRWRPAIAFFLGVGTVWLAGAYVIAGNAVARGNVKIEPSGDLRAIDYPSGGWAWWGIVQWVWFVALFAIGLAWLLSRVPAYRRATGERRQQLKWLVFGGVVAVLGGVFSVVLSGQSGVLGAIAGVSIIGLYGIPLGIGVAITRYRLYDIDRLISRTLLYTLLTAALLSVFAGLVLLSTRVLPFSSPVGVAASTLAAAALFNPLRHRLQRFVDRRFNRARYDADALVASFGARLRDAVDLDTVRLGLLETATSAVEPAHLSVWLRDEA